MENNEGQKQIRLRNDLY